MPAEVGTETGSVDGGCGDVFSDLEGADWVVTSISDLQARVLRAVTTAVYELVAVLRTPGSSNGICDASAKEGCSSSPQLHRDRFQSHFPKAAPSGVPIPTSISVLLPALFHSDDIHSTNCRESNFSPRKFSGSVPKLGNEHIRVSHDCMMAPL